jgi:hypothetical protein
MIWMENGNCKDDEMIERGRRTIKRTSTMTGASSIGTAIENKLNGQVNIVSLGPTSHFDAISKRAQCPMSLFMIEKRTVHV